ncbi:unnamed protein product (macronuclear) [Paramecium tetraurelia]|uniref:Phospholipid-transporting ATPase n=1 Tax=Paramecium tetraurelia TaxID=5888 RepID=A0BBP3_PARTE|nr:uncharacterized protein GSPATT00000395001 [Paramecium tetraurelia]CAK55960.1 unnamed protein product [Paramecium tetraurelia]|eukprot:XP_001423358.1 hypothetical protein (macronuclear) [Paramecium tetraurelia strain d4-2]
MFKSDRQKYNKERIFPINATGKVESEVFPTNFIKTSKYNIVTFLPLSLLGQFRRYANIYFLFIAIIQSFPIISPLNPISAIAPLVFVLGLSMIREAMEDISRHKSDNEVNAMECTKIVNNKQVKTTWADVRVGDLLFVSENEMFPADIIVLTSYFESGVCYIETSSLDGEKNLKPKSAIKETQTLFQYKEVDSKIQMSMTGNQQLKAQGNPPTPALGDFEGSIHFQNGSKKVLNGKQLLLRGAFLRNTKFIVGVIVYTGEDTKIMRNAEPSRIKQSTIEGVMNKLILGILGVQIIACALSAVLSSWWLYKSFSKHIYIIISESNYTLLSAIAFFSFFLLYNTMIPISLVVSMEFVKVFQCYFINKDWDMYSSKRDKFAKAQTSTINEELGQVEYVFSDKTGTLTCNQMEFKYCIIGDILYGKSDKSKNMTESISNKNNAQQDPAQFKHSVFNFQDPILTGIIENSQDCQRYSDQQRKLMIQSTDKTTTLEIKTQKQLVHEYLMLLSSAHECIAQKDKNSQIVYQGPSPDEITLVDAAMNLGYRFEGQSANEQEFTIKGKQKKVELLSQFEFDSNRKRMSVIIKDNGVYKLYIKGADSIIKARLRPDQPFLGFIQNKLSEFSTIGLRTLLMAMKILSEQEYLAFERQKEALASSENREQEREELANNLEKDLYLLGATAVEDKLQDDVPETIADLLKANIKVWMLTGDKLETAENIAKSCRLIQHDFMVMKYSETDLNKLRVQLSENKLTYQACIRERKKKSVLVEGEALVILTANQQLKREFTKMAMGCDSVVCCRVTPKQKAEVVHLVKNLNKITLAIGDGANDVNMIQEAHIGIGLYGNEGMRAVQSSDYALGEFRFLWKLLLIHGNWSYIRISEMILYFFYKNMIFTVPQFLFSFYSAYSAQTYFDDWYITFYNLFFTSLPLIARATLDRKCLLQKSMQEIKTTLTFIRNQLNILKQTIFTLSNFIFWWGQGFIHGVFVFFITYACFDTEFVNIEGQNAGFATLSITAYTAIIFIVDIKIALYTKFWTCVNVITLLLFSVGIYIAYFFVSNYFRGTYSEFTPIYLIQSPTFYLIIALLNCIVFIFDLVINAVLHEFYSTETDKIIKWRREFKEIAREGNVLQKIEMMQQGKRENGQRDWGDTFYEQILDERLKSERDQNIFDEQQAILDSKAQHYATSPVNLDNSDQSNRQFHQRTELQQIPHPLQNNNAKIINYQMTKQQQQNFNNVNEDSKINHPQQQKMYVR